MTVAVFRPAAGAEPIPGYRLEAFLGRGGFGEVWRTVAPGGFPVALKFLAVDEAASERELRSLRLLQHLRDGHLLSIQGVWRIAGHFLLAMELADGTLSDRLEDCRKQGLPGVPRDELLEYFGQAARGIDFLNEPRHVLEPGARPAAIQHADIKPQNLLLVGTACKVGDFGLLRRLGSASQKTHSMTAAFAPPEVFAGQPTRTSDQYSLAVSWCLLRGGRLPFDGGPLQLLYAHAHTPPDLTMLPEGERPAVKKALSKAPGERWPSCAAVVEALRTAPGGVVPPAGRSQATQPLTPDSSTATSPYAPPSSTKRLRPVSRGRAVLWLSLAVVLPLGVLLAIFLATGPPNRWGVAADRRVNADDTARDGAKDAGAEHDKGERDGQPPRDKDGAGPKDKGPQKGQPYTNTIGMKFAWIEPNPDSFFWMGSPDGQKPPGVPAEAERSNDETPHRVTLTKGYHLGVHLVTQEQWERVMKTNPSKFDGDKKKLPVDTVSWYDCVEFCNKLSELEGRKPCYELTNVQRAADGRITSADVKYLAGGTGYRLPTEAEWEYACRAGTTTAFWWGDSITPEQANYDYNYTYGRDGKKGTYREKTTLVDFFPANKWGLHDMHGNLYQWCEDWYAPYADGDIKDPCIKDKKDIDAHVLRGGSWCSDPRFCRAAIRSRDAPALRVGHFGCRVVLRLD